MKGSRNNVFISVVSADQNFSKSSLCKSCSNGSIVQEISTGMLGVLKESMDHNYTAFINIKAKYIKELVLRIVGGSDDEEYSDDKVYFDVCISFP